MEFLFIPLVLGLIPAMIANSKGKSFMLWWLYGFLLFIIALPHSLIMKADREMIERRAMESGDNRKCPNCAEIIKAEAKVCRFCGRDVTPTA